MRIPPPRSEEELAARVQGLAGRPLAWVAGELSVAVPGDLRRKKGWVGQLLELALGASAGSRAEPDFAGIGVELKTLPVDPAGKPLQSTYVSTAPLDGTLPATWGESWVRRKLARVLWLPILVPPGAPPGERVVGAGFLWSPSPEQDRRLRQDWEELSELVRMGRHDQIDARLGEVLQLRPKAASARSTTWTLDAHGDFVEANPRGFYLRPAFTAALLAQALTLPRAR